MKIVDLIKKLMEFDMHDDARVEVVNTATNTRTTVQVNDILRLNDEGDPHVGLLVDFDPPEPRARLEARVQWSEKGGWEIY